MLKLLVIDDESSIRFSIEQVFEGDDVQVFTAGTVDEGLQVAAAQAPDLILLDIMLGKQSGLELFRDLRRIDPNVRVVFITGHGSAETAAEAIKLGALDYLVKPLDIKQLQDAVFQALRFR